MKYRAQIKITEVIQIDFSSERTDRLDLYNDALKEHAKQFGFSRDQELMVIDLEPLPEHEEQDASKH